MQKNIIWIRLIFMEQVIRAGAQILGQYAAISSNEKYAGKFTFQIPKKNVFEAIVLNCGVYQVNYECRRSDLVRMIAFEYLNLENKNPEQITEEEYHSLYEQKIDLFEFWQIYYITVSGYFACDI